MLFVAAERFSEQPSRPAAFAVAAGHPAAVQSAVHPPAICRATMRAVGMDARKTFEAVRARVRRKSVPEAPRSPRGDEVRRSHHGVGPRGNHRHIAAGMLFGTAERFSEQPSRPAAFAVAEGGLGGLAASARTN
jgi:hypothetical protein